MANAQLDPSIQALISRPGVSAPATPPPPAITLSDEQSAVVDAVVSGKNVLVDACIGSGKALTNDSRVPTPRGWRLVKDIRVGDELYTAEGVPTRVVGVFPQGVEDVYEVELSDGRVIRCSASHNWWVRRTTRRVREFEVLTTEQMLAAGVMRVRSGSGFKKACYRIPAHKAIEMPEVALPVDPYVVGAFIGNGSCTEPRLALSSGGSEVPEKVARILGLTTKRRSQKNYTWDFFTTEGHSVHTKDVLGSIAEFVCHKSGDKQIPDEYLTGSIVQRKELIRGLMDTDGSISSNNRRNVSYSTTSEKLMRGLCDLLGSVGWTAHATTDGRSHKYASKVCYNIGVYVPNDEKSDMFSCGRKAELAESAADLPKRRDYSEISVVDIRKVDAREEMTCFEVEDESHLFLADNYVVTHNTSTIQELCTQVGRDRRVLYLTYSKLLKLDAQRRVMHAKVQNYHGIVYPSLLRAGIKCGIGESIRRFNEAFEDLRAGFPVYDLLVIDEYQDINEEYARLVANILSTNPRMQLVMVGDMAQRVRSDTTLDVGRFVAEVSRGAVELPFTQSFRMGDQMAALLSAAWNKPIVGVNPDQEIIEIPAGQAIEFMADREPGQLLALGKRNGPMADALNQLENKHGDVFNKDSVYASIREGGSAVSYGDDAAVFTTFDASKGLERHTSMIFDYDEDLWDIRQSLPGTDPEVLRNVFLVAASRGKNEVVFVKGRKAPQASSSPRIGAIGVERFRSLPNMVAPTYENPINPADAFAFKYAENVRECFDLLEVERVDDGSDREIEIESQDGLIDLSPAISHFQSALYFEKYDARFEMQLRNSDAAQTMLYELGAGPWRDALALAVADTDQTRYIDQVTVEVPAETQRRIVERLASLLPSDARTQVGAHMSVNAQGSGLSTPMGFEGVIDALHDEVAYGLEFTSELSYGLHLELALKMVMLDIETGVLWNVRTGERRSISVPDKTAFLDAVVRCVSKQFYTKAGVRVG